LYMKTKITLLFMTALLLMSNHTFAQVQKEVKNVAIFVHEGVELFDFAGPGEVFVAAGRQSPVIDFNVYTVAATEDPITSQTFLKVIPNYSIDNCPKPDVIVLPGGATGIPLRNPDVLNWIKASNEESDITLSVCTGAFLLAETGLLDGLKATTHWGSIQGLKDRYPNTEVLENTKFVDNGKIVTSGGVSSGTEGSLHVVSRMAGKETAREVARYMEYNGWDNRMGLIDKENPFITKVKEKGFRKMASQIEDYEVFYGELINLGVDLFEEGQIDAALPLFEYLGKKYPVSEPNNYLVKIYKKKGKPVPITEDEIVELITKGNVDEAISAYEENRKKFPDWFIFGENTMNIMGYRLMGAQKMEDALKVFELNAKEHSKSFNVWDSLAECHMRSGNKEKARKYYKKSLELNPENENAKKMLEKLD